MQIETKCLHEGYKPENGGPGVMPIVQSTTYRFAKHDKAQFPDIIKANENGTPYYTNSSHLPVGYTEDIF